MLTTHPAEIQNGTFNCDFVTFVTYKNPGCIGFIAMSFSKSFINTIPNRGHLFMNFH